MKYQEIYNEYTAVLSQYSKLRFELSNYPKGNIVKKRISQKEYYYLQYSVSGKKKTEYLKENEVQEVAQKLNRANEVKQMLEAIESDLSRLENAVEILEPKMRKTFFFLRQCADMDAMPIAKRTNAISFASAMTALEGLPALEETEKALQKWATGEISFAEFYLPSLQKYNVVEG